MAFVLRLIVALATLLLCSVAHAISPTPDTEYGGNDIGWFSSGVAACQAFVAFKAAEQSKNFVYASYNPDNRYCSYDYDRGEGWISYGFGGAQLGERVVDTCPPNSTLEGGSCQCNSGYQVSGGNTSCLPIPPPPCEPPNVITDGVCGPPPPPPPECKIPLGSVSNGSTAQYTGAGYGGGMGCFQQCISYPSFSGRSPEGKYFAHGPWTSTGATCSGTGSGSSPPPPSDPTDPGSPPADPAAPPDPDPPPLPPAPDQCKVGTCPGSVNGTTVCVPCSNTTSNSTNKSNSTSNKTNPDGTPNNDPDPSNPSGGSPNGTTNSTSTNTTKCVGGKCTTDTKTTTTNPDGTTTTKTDKKEETQEDFCTKNPKSPLCVEGTFGGACSGGFACTGDAVQCATAKATNDLACSLKADASDPLVLTGNGSMTGNNPSDHPLSLKTDLDVGSLNQSNPWGAGCPSDKVLTTFMGEAIVVPLSSACGTFQAMGNVLVGLALLAGSFIVVGRK